MNLKDQRAAAVKSLREIVEKAKADNDGVLTPEQLTEADGFKSTIEELNEKIERATKSASIMDAVGALPADDAGDQSGDAPAAKSVGEHFVKQVGDRLKGSAGSRFSLSAPEFKAASDSQVTSGLTFATVDNTVVQGFREQPTVAGLLGSGTLTGTSLTYYVEGIKDGAFTTVAEGGAKPQLHYNYSTLTDALSKIAGFIKVSDEMIEDLPFIMSEINGRLLYDLSIFEEAQLLNGNGTAPNLRGILNRTGVQTEAATTAVSGADNADAIFRSLTKVQTATGLAADGIVINPADYQSLRLQRDSNEQYYGGGFFAGQYGVGGVPVQPPLWGVNTVVTSAIASGTVLVGAFNQGGTVYRKGGVRVESTNSHEDDFTNNMVTIRAEERLALAVRRPNAFVKATLNYAAA